jgi:hypothetical protein
VFELAPVEENALAFGALLHDNAGAFVLVHGVLTFRTQHLHHDINLS